MIEEGEGEGEGERHSSPRGGDDGTPSAVGAVSTGLPTSPSWRRSPSYEQLQQIELDAHRLVKSSGTRMANSSLRASPPHSSERRTLTLSVSGSEAESIYGKPIPHTYRKSRNLRSKNIFVVDGSYEN